MPLFDPQIGYVTIRGSFRLLFATLGSWNVEGQHHIPKSGPGIIISNHVSYVDPPLMGSAVRRPVAYMAKSELFTGNKALAWVCRVLESYPVRQGMIDRDALRETYSRLERNWLIGIFPEGTRSLTGELQEFQPGLAMIALKSKAPVIPAGIAGAREMLPPHAKRIYKSHLEVHFGPPLDLDDLYEMNDKRQAMAELTARAHSAVAEMIKSAREAREAWYKR